MVFKKISSVIALVLSLALLVHVALSMSLIYSVTTEYLMVRTCALFVFGIASIHILCSIITFFACKGIDDVKQESKTRAQSILSLIFAILAILLLTLHFNDYIHALYNNVALLCVVEVAFIICVFGHIALSIGKALKTLGIIKTDKGQKTFTIVNCTICALVTIFCCVLVVCFLMI